MADKVDRRKWIRNQDRAYDLAAAEDAERSRDAAIAENAARDKSKLTKNLIILGVLTIIVIGFIFFVPAAYKIIFGIAAVALTLVWFGSKKEKRVFNIIVVSAIVIAIVVFLPQLQLWASEGYSKASGIATTLKSGTVSKSTECITNPSKCFGEQSWQTSSQQSLGSLVIMVDWKAAVYSKPNIYIPVSVKTENPLLLNLQCFSEKSNIDTQPTYLEFGKGEDTVKSLRCSGDITDKLGLKISTKSNLSTTAIVWAGKADSSKGKLSKKVSGPYSLEISAIESMPFANSKEVFIKLKKESDFNLTKINSFDVQTIGSNIALNCPTMTGSSQELAANFKDNTYTFVCDLDVLNIPLNAEQSSINLDVDYSLEASYRTNLNITKT
jgi:hypothetical protein